MPHPLPPARPCRMPVAALAAAAIPAGSCPGGGWSDSIALLALVAAITAAHERRTRAVTIAAGLAAGLAPAGLLLTPLYVGLTIRHGRGRFLPLMMVVALAVALLLPWNMPTVGLPNLALLAIKAPAYSALVAAFGVGIAAWLAARASVLPHDALWHEAQLGTLALAVILPLPIGTLAFVATMAAIPLPARARYRAANDNIARRRPPFYDPAQDRLALFPGGG